jgi:hypothetical protein
VGLVDRLLGRSGGSPPELNLAELRDWLGAALARQTGRPADPLLVRARLADRCRDTGVRPLLPDEFEALARDLDTEALRRLTLLVGTLDLESVRGQLPALTAERALIDLVGEAFTGLARTTPLLTLELLAQSPLRVEELARKFLDRLGAAVKGEKPAMSRQQLERLDYERLLEEAERARAAAEERVERLRRLQEEQEANRPRRGKW